MNILQANLTKEIIINAIHKIDKQPELISGGRQSIHYDLLYKNEHYPPILVLSEANKLLGGNELLLSDFSNAQNAFEIITRLSPDFQIKPKDKTGFSYVPFFQQLGKSLLPYRNRQKDLVQILKKIGNEKNLTDNDGKKQFELEEIDPFTFFAFFMKIGSFEKREILFRKLRQLLQINISSPNDFLGVPSAQAMQVWYFGYKEKRRVDDISILWDLAQQAIEGEIENETFIRALNIYSIRLAKLTQGLFYLNPEKYYPIDSHSSYIELAGISTNVNSIDDYKNILIDIENTFRKPFYEISHDAWKSDNNKMHYWIFQGNPNDFDYHGALKSNMLNNWSVTAHRDKIITGDKVILWMTGRNAGCYALAEVTHEPKIIINDNNITFWKAEDKNPIKAGLKITHSLLENPLTYDKVRSIKEFSKLKVGNQGTNFTASKEEYLKMLELTKSMNSKRYWLYAPGEKADQWDDFYSNGIMALGWDHLGDLAKYKTKQEIELKLQKEAGTENSKKNDSAANYEFKNVMQIGDIVFVKKGRSELLGYGEVVSDYYYDSDRDNYKSCRKVKWLKRGVWNANHKLVLKTLTDITTFPTEDKNSNSYHERLFGLMNVENGQMPKYSRRPLNTILYGPPGTGKTYNSIDLAVEIATGRSLDHSENKRVFDGLRNEGQIEFVTFHQNYSYEDFMVGIRPDVEFEKLRFKPYKGIFYEISRRARENYMASNERRSKEKNFEEVFEELLSPLYEEKEVEIKMISKKSFWITDVNNSTIFFRKSGGGTQHTLSIDTLRDLVRGTKEMPSGLSSYYRPLMEIIMSNQKIEGTVEELKRFVLIIDEINRANISKVFGELITLLEDDKRLGAENELRITLPNGEKDFGVPPNLYVIGTMNTADKSIALIDIALRRRFEFIGYYPKYEGYDAEAIELLKNINTAIYNKKSSPDYLIGHAYFMNGANIETALKNKVIPLLMEYFAGKTDTVAQIFSETGWSIKYDIVNYNWQISRKHNGIAI